MPAPHKIEIIIGPRMSHDDVLGWVQKVTDRATYRLKPIPIEEVKIMCGDGCEVVSTIAVDPTRKN